MPPQQPNGLLDLIDQILHLCAHGTTVRPFRM
jgi:hypothetical protein